MHRFAALALLAALCLAALPATEGAVREETFAALKSSQEPQLVLFYHSKEGDSKNVLQTFERASSKTRKLRDLKYKRCDCDSAANLQDCKEASFTQGSFIFTSTPETGIVKFISPITVDNLVEHANNLFLDYDDKNVVPFVDEESFFERMDSTDPPRPTFVKFYEDWCGHCQRLKPTFARTATQLKGKVDFVEVHCSKNDVTKAFCTRNQVSSFPVVMLFTGEKKIKFEKEERSVLTMTRFLEEHVPGLRSSRGAADDEDGESAPEPVKEKPKEQPKEQPKKRASSDDDDDDELNEEEERRAREQAKEEKKKRKAREKEERQKKEEREAEEQAKRDKAKEEKDKSEKAKEEKEKKSVKPPYGGSQSGAPAGERDDSNKAASSSSSSGGASDQRVDAIENRVKFLVQRVTQLEEFREAQDEQIRRLKKRVKALKLTVRGLSTPAGSAAAAKDEDDDDKDEL